MSREDRRRFLLRSFSSIILATRCVTSSPIITAAKVRPPEPYGPTPSPRQLRWHELEFYGFIHFTVSRIDESLTRRSTKKPHCCRQTGALTGRFKQLDRVSIRIFQLDLLPAWTNLHFISKPQTGFF